MKQKATYAEKLKNPKWQKKRLEVMNRDGWQCVNCFDTEMTLHVHHLLYDGDPWEVDSKYLVTLCEDCHSAETANRRRSEDKLLTAIKNNHFLSFELDILANGFANLKPFHAPEIMASVIEFALTNPAIMKDLENKMFAASDEARKGMNPEDCPY